MQESTSIQTRVGTASQPHFATTAEYEAWQASLPVKTCRTCGTLRPIHQFFRDWRSPARFRPDCKLCHSRRTHGTRGNERPPAAPPAATAPPPPPPTPADPAPEPPLSQRGRRRRRMDLGIAIAHSTCRPGERRTYEEIAAYANVTPEAIRRLERQALAKLRPHLAAALQSLGLKLREVTLP